MFTTADRLKQLMEMRKLKQIDILRLVEPYCNKYKVKLGKSDLSQFVSGKVKPGQSKLSILGLALDVSEGWLMGLPVPMERDEEPEEPEKAPTLVIEDERTVEFLNLFSQLSEAEQNIVLAQIKGILAAR